MRKSVDALIVVWDASHRICGKRLKRLMPLIVEAMERHKHFQLAPDIRARLLAMSAATIDRALRTVREHAGGRGRRAGTIIGGPAEGSDAHLLGPAESATRFCG